MALGCTNGPPKRTEGCSIAPNLARSPAAYRHRKAAVRSAELAGTQDLGTAVSTGQAICEQQDTADLAALGAWKSRLPLRIWGTRKRLADLLGRQLIRLYLAVEGDHCDRHVSCEAGGYGSRPLLPRVVAI